MLYHILVNLKNQKKSDSGHLKKDSTREELIKRFIDPYEQGTAIVMNGKTIQLSEIDRITIRASERELASYIAELKAEDSNSSQKSLQQILPYWMRAWMKLQNVTDEFIQYPSGHRKDKLVSLGGHPQNNDLSKVFIVHGHDEAAKTKTARFIERLGYSAIILHEQASSGRTIIEKIEQHTDVGFAVVLYTPDDVGSIKGAQDAPKSRARQNVVFEHGFLIGKLGRARVIALVDGDLEHPNDVSGVVYIAMDKADAWHLQLAKEMRQVGFDIDLNKLI